MTIIISPDDYQDLIAEGVTNKSQADGEITSQYSSSFGKMNRWSLELRPGLELGIEEQYYNQSLIVQQPEREHPIELNFYRIGNHKESILRASRAGENGLFGSGICPKGQLEYPAKQQFLSIDLHIEPNCFRNLIGQGFDFFSEAIQLLIRDDQEWLYSIASQTTPSMDIVLQQILNCPYQSYLKRIYLEGKVLELITLRLEQLIESSNPSIKQLRPSERDRVHHAQQILDQSLEQAPTLAELSRQVGLNEKKLKQGFQEVFATSPFAYLRDRRLEKARELLMNPEKSVQEVATATGYASRSQFANAFRKKFGVNPKSYQLHFR